MFHKLFGHSKKAIWEQLAEEMGVAFHDANWGRESVEAQYNDWLITLDTYVVSNGKSSTTYTQMRAPFENNDGFRFVIYKRNVFHDIGKFFGMKDVEVGYPDFDRDYIIQGNDEFRLKKLFENDRIRKLIQEQPMIRLEVKPEKRGFRKSRQGNDMLYFRVVGVIKDKDRLKKLFDLFAETLDQMCHLDSAYENFPEFLEPY
jgi:hypothetical protein